MSKKINGDKIEFEKTPINALGSCSSSTDTCQRTIANELKIKGHPSAGRELVCVDKNCIIKGKATLAEKYKKSKADEELVNASLSQ